MIVDDKGELNVTEENAKNPCFWSRVCLNNMAKLGKEATTMRRILESLFRSFDDSRLWSDADGLDLPVLKDLQSLMDDSGHNTHLILFDIVKVTNSLTVITKVQPTVVILSAVGDIIRHLRKSIQLSIDSTNSYANVLKWNISFGEVVDKCPVELSLKIPPKAAAVGMYQLKGLTE